MAKKPKAQKLLVENVDEAWKFASVWVGAAIAVITAANEWMPGLQGFMSPGIYAAVMGIMGVVVIIARIANQNIAKT